MMKSRRHIVFITIIVLFASLIALGLNSGGVVTAEATRDEQAAYEAVAQLNEWRLSLGLAPLKWNDTLADLAFYQADYVRTLHPIPDEEAIHVGRNGEGVRQRALYDPFDWPTYGRPDQIVIGEIAAVNDLEGAVAFWKSSKPHRETVINPAYREVGAVAIPHPYGYIYFVDLGGRPNVLPVLADPRNDILYLTDDPYKFHTGNPPLSHPTQVRLFDEAGRPLLDGKWIDWAPTIPIPENAGSKLYVLYTDGTQEAMSEVDLERDRVILPGYIPTPQPSFAGAGAAPEIVATSTSEPPRPELAVIYDQDSLSIVNIASKPISLRGLQLVSETNRLTMQWWLDVADVPLDAFPPNNCLQTWSGDLTSIPPSPPYPCTLRRSGRGNMRAEDRFWLQASFAVRYGGRVLATCEVGAGECDVDFDLP
jgi:uncharacterized protein YkwD